MIEQALRPAGGFHVFEPATGGQLDQLRDGPARDGGLRQGLAAHDPQGLVAGRLELRQDAAQQVVEQQGVPGLENPIGDRRCARQDPGDARRNRKVREGASGLEATPWCPKTRSWSQSIDQEQAGNCRISAEEAAEWPGTVPYRTMDIAPG